MGTGDETRTLLITGVSSGIGLGMARTFIRQGYRVFGSVRTESQARELEATLGDAFSPLIFDVRDGEAIERAMGVVRDSVPRLVGLINSAGSAEIGPLLYVPVDDLSRQLDVLVVGQLRVIQAVFPLLHGGVGAPGRIINISSISGVGVNRFFGCYATAKHALEGLSKTLRNEVQAFGVKVIVVAPGNIVTDIWGKQKHEMIEAYRGTPYFPELEAALQQISKISTHGSMSIEEFSGALYDIFCLEQPVDRYTVVKKRWSRLPFARARMKVVEG